MGKLNVNICKLQMVYFFKEDNSFDTVEFVNSIHKQLKDIFDKETIPQLLQIPQNITDIPYCIWNDVNRSLEITKSRLDFVFNLTSTSSWNELLTMFNQKIAYSFTENKMIIDRVGLVSELSSPNDLHELLKKRVNIAEFNNAEEANISWIEKIEMYNICTYIQIIRNENEDRNKIIFDINGFSENKLSKQGISGENAMIKCKKLLEGKIENVLL